MKYPTIVAPKPVDKTETPSSAISYLTVFTNPLYLWGSNYILVFATSTGQSAPWVTPQQIPPAAAPLRKYIKSNFFQSYYELAIYFFWIY